MVGVIFIFAAITYAVIQNVKNGIEDLDNRERFRNNETHSYLDHDGRRRDLRTNKCRGIISNNVGDSILVGEDIEDINLSQDKREQEYYKYKSLHIKGRTAVYWSPSPFYREGKKNLLGKRYKDLNTGKILIVRSNQHKNFYIDLDTLSVLRYTDSQIRFMKKHNEYFQEKEIADVLAFQELVSKQRYDENYIGDPTIGTTTSSYEDFWPGEKIYY